MKSNAYPCTFKQFLILGQLGFIEPGVSQDTILLYMGKPGRQLHRVWTYGSLELWWDTAQTTLNTIYLNNSSQNGMTLPDSIQMYDYFPRHDTSLLEMLLYLRQEGIDYKKNEYDYYKDLWIAPNITMTFRGHQQYPRLSQITCYKRHHRQVMV